MPVQLNSSAKQLDDNFINRTMVVEMVDYYRKNRRKSKANSIKFAHFPVSEIIDLLVDNKIINPLPSQQPTDITKYGLKIYLANHAGDPKTCPPDRADYRDRDTVILCNTQLTDDTWTDILNDDKWVSLVGAGTGKAIDKGGICPPDCPGAGPAGKPASQDVSSEP